MKRVCFISLKRDHRRIDCESPKCVTCTGPHHTLLHNSTKIPRDLLSTPARVADQEIYDYSNGNPEINNSLPVLSIANRVDDVTVGMQLKKNGYRISNRCMLPIVNTVVKGNNICEVNII